MKNQITTKAAALAILVIVLSSYNLPKDWFKAGSQPASYDMGIDIDGGKNVATIKSNTGKIKGFGTLMQESLPGKYLGKKVKMSGMMKSENIDDWAGFWFRVDGSSRSKSLAFDNMQDRPVKGTTDWKKYEIVLDVPTSATNLAYGALVSGTGQIWFSDIKFEILTDSVTASGTGPRIKPENLNFEQ